MSVPRATSGCRCTHRSRVSDRSELEEARVADQVLNLDLLFPIVEHLGERRPGLHISPLKLRGTLILAEFDPQDLETSEAGKRQLSLALKSLSEWVALVCVAVHS